MPHSDTHVLGLISDTHGLIRPGVHSALTGVELILHAGDVGGAQAGEGVERYDDIIPEGVSWVSWWFGTSTMT